MQIELPLTTVPLTRVPSPTPHPSTPPPPPPHTQASSANESGDHETAKKFGRISLGWNIGVYIFYGVVTIIWVAVVASRCTSFFGRLICF